MTCPCCGGSPRLLGPLGALVWLKCVACGWEWSIEKDDEDV